MMGMDELGTTTIARLFDDGAAADALLDHFVSARFFLVVGLPFSVEGGCTSCAVPRRLGFGPYFAWVRLIPCSALFAGTFYTVRLILDGSIRLRAGTSQCALTPAFWARGTVRWEG